MKGIRRKGRMKKVERVWEADRIGILNEKRKTQNVNLIKEKRLIALSV